MEEKARRYGIFGIDFISYWDLLNGENKYENIFIDEIDVFVDLMLTQVGKVKGYTLSIED